MLSVLVCRGIGESKPSPMLSNVTRLLDPKRFVVKEVPWSASYGSVPAPFGSSFDTSLREGRTLLLRMIKDDPNPVILLGFSGGAALAGNVAAEIGRGEHPQLVVNGVGLISDPLRHTLNTNDKVTGWGTDKFGIAGARAIVANFPVWSMADPADVITCCPVNSPLRTISDQSAAFSLIDPKAWGWDLVERLRQQRWQATIRDWRNVREVWAAYSAAIDGAQGYLFARDHISYASRIYRDGKTYTQWLADRINEIRE